METEVDGERIGLTLWDSQGLERSVADIQMHGVVSFLDSKFEDTLTEELRVVRSPGVRDTHIHCTFLLLDPVNLDKNIAAAKRAANGGSKTLDPRLVGILDNRMDIQVLRAIKGKTTVIPIISKADTITTSHMAYLKRAVWESLKKANIDPLDVLTLGDQDEEESSSEDGEKNTNQEGPIIPFSILSPDPETLLLSSDSEPVGRHFPWGFADPYNDAHCDFVKLKDSVFNEWRSDLCTASREVWYERWRTNRLNSFSPERTPQVSPHMSPQISPQRSPQRSPKRSPKMSPKRSLQMSPQMSPRRGSWGSPGIPSIPL